MEKRLALLALLATLFAAPAMAVDENVNSQVLSNQERAATLSDQELDSVKGGTVCVGASGAVTGDQCVHVSVECSVKPNPDPTVTVTC